MAAQDETHAGGRAHADQASLRLTAVSPAAKPQFLSLKSGLTIRQYVIEEVIGAGGFGITYRARHDRLQAKIFALKEYFPREYAARTGTQVVSTPDGGGTFRWGLERFLKEAEALAKCEHPGIVDVVDYFEANGTAYAVLGYIEGQQLGQWLDGLGRPPTQAELDQILMPLLDALDVVHAAKLLHLDIAPDNILIRRDGSPCLIDFGACRDDIRGRSGKVSAIVKHGYSPPEQYHGLAELQGPWTDIYATGATLYRAVSGALPMDSARRGSLGDTLQPMGAMARGDYRPAFLAAIDMALRLKPDERPQSVAAWRKMLTATGTLPVVEGSVTASRPQAPPPPAPSVRPERADAGAGTSSGGGAADTKRSGIRRPVLIGAAAVALIGSMSALALWRSPEPARPVAQTRPQAAAMVEAAKTSASVPVPADPAVPGQAVPAQAVPGPAVPIPAQTPVIAATGSALPVVVATPPPVAAAVRERDADFAACLGPEDALKVAACTRVVASDDSAERRATALHLRGVAERKRGNHDRAIADLGQSLALVANQPDVLNDRGIAHFLKGDGPAAISDYSEAIRLNAGHADALNNRAWAIHQAGRASDALPDANRAVELAPAKAYVFDTRGHILEALSRRDDAIRDYERALALDPGQDDSRKALDRLKVRR